MQTIKNIIKVIISNLTTILAGVFVSFFLPKIISLTDYGFYKIFSLYFNYLGVLSLGIIDGIVLKYGNKNYDELEQSKFRSIFLIYTLVHLFFVFILITISLIFFNDDYRFIFLMLAAMLIPANYNGYFQQLSQITQRFREYSLRKVLQSLLNVAFVASLLLLFKLDVLLVNYKIYIVGSILIALLLATWYIFTYRDIIFGIRDSFKSGVLETISLIKLGFPLLVANLCSTLLLSMDRQFVSLFFSTEEYATYAFAYSMLSLVTVAASATSTVIYPLFKRFDKDLLRKKYALISEIVLIVVFLLMLVYNPLCYFIEWFLPKYTESLLFFRIILPGVSLSSAITVILHNYYKVFDKNVHFFIISIIALAFSVGLNFGAYFLFKSRESITIASIISTFIWYGMASYIIRKECHFSLKNFFYILIMFGTFYFVTSLTVYWKSFICQLISYILITYIFFEKDYQSIKTLVIK